MWLIQSCPRLRFVIHDYVHVINFLVIVFIIVLDHCFSAELRILHLAAGGHQCGLACDTSSTTSRRCFVIFTGFQSTRESSTS